MSQVLKDKRIAILVADGFEQIELTAPRKALQEAGAVTEIVSPNPSTVQGFNHFDKADAFDVNVPLELATAEEYDCLVLPGGVGNPDQLRTIPKAVEFVRGFADSGKPIAAICHGPWTLIEANAVRGRTLTSWPSLKTDLRNAGATWVDQEVVTDRGLVTSRNPDDLPAFNLRMIEEFAEGPRASALHQSDQPFANWQQSW